METMRKYNLIAGLFLGVLLLTGCGIMETSKKDHTPRIFGATYMTRNNPYFDVLHGAIQEVVEANGDFLISRNPCQDQEKQNSQIMEMIDEGIQVLFLNPVDLDKVRPALEECKKAGVVVIDVDTMAKDMEYVTAAIETDNYQAGVLCAQDMMKRRDHASIIVINNPIQESINNRIQGFMDTVAGNPDYQVIAETGGAGEFEVSADAMAALLRRNLDFDVVMGGNDPTALGALATLQRYHQEEGILIYGIDGSPDFKSMLKLGYVTATSMQSPKTIGRVAAETAYQYLDGQKVEKYISIEPQLITRENLDQYEVNDWQ